LDDIVIPEHGRRMSQTLRDAGVDMVDGEFQTWDHFSTANWIQSGLLILGFLDVALQPWK
jgi:hypothetical protein